MTQSQHHNAARAASPAVASATPRKETPRAPRMTVRLSVPCEARLIEAARTHKLSRSAIIAVALDQYLASSGAPQTDRISRRLDRLASQVGHIDRDIQILLESLGLLALYLFSQGPTLKDADLPAAQARGRKRYQDYIKAVAEQLGTARGLAPTVLATMAPASGVDA